MPKSLLPLFLLIAFGLSAPLAVQPERAPFPGEADSKAGFCQPVGVATPARYEAEPLPASRPVGAVAEGHRSGVETARDPAQIGLAGTLDSPAPEWMLPGVGWLFCPPARVLIRMTPGHREGH